MGTKEISPPGNSGKRAVSEELDALNARVRRQRIPRSSIRRSMEATLQEKSRKRRTTQSPASSGWKR